MNPDLPRSPREELEASLTALLLGELSAEKAAALREVIEHDAELVRLLERLKNTIALVRQTAVSPAEETADQPEPLLLRQDRYPFPYLPPRMKAPVLSPGTMTMQCAFSSRS